MDIDLVRLNFSPKGLLVLQVIIALIIYGISLKLNFNDFYRLVRKPKALLTGLIAYYIIFPALTVLLIYMIELRPSIALGLIIVTACPGGNSGNIYTNFCRGSTPLSIGLVSLTTIMAVITTPFLIVFLGKYVPGMEEIVRSVELSPFDIFKGVFIILGVPLTFGMLTSRYYPHFASKTSRIIGKASLVFLVLFIIGAFLANVKIFITYFNLIVGISLLHYILALLTGVIVSKFAKVNTEEMKAITFAHGIRNTVLGLGIVFQFFENMGGMAIIVAWWGVSQMAIGLIASQVWRKFTLKEVEL